MSESVPDPQQPGATGGASGAGGTPTGGSSSRGPIDPQALATANKLDLATIGLGVLTLIASFLPFYTMSYEGFGSDSVSAWHGFFGWFGAFCALAAGAVLAAHLVGVKLPVPVRLVVLALFAVALVCMLLAMFVYPGESCEDAMGAFMSDEICDSFDEGRGFGYWLALLSTAAGTALAAMRRSAA